MSEWKKQLNSITEDVLFDEPMKNHTSFKIGGLADAIICPKSVEEIREILAFAKTHNIPCMVMGNGSNMLVSDDGICGIVIKICGTMQNIEVSGNSIHAQCGVMLSKLSNIAAKNQLSGLEFAAGIPGTLGGAIYMNAGAYGGEMKDIIKSVDYINSDNEIKTATGDELEFGYRTSRFANRGDIIVSCEIELSHGVEAEIKATMADYTNRRTQKQPLDIPSAGSTFKRPEGYFAGKLIEDAGLKGYGIGGAEVSVKHSGFVVNAGGATASDVCELIEHIQKTVYDKFGVHLETEVRRIGK